MPRLRLRRPLPLAVAGVVALTAVVLAVEVLGGCAGGSGGPVAVSRPPGGVTVGCAAVLAALPDRVNGQQQRRTTGYRYAAAWGDPAIVLRCGVTRGRGYHRTSGCQTVDGVDWYLPADQVGDQGADAVFTLLHRTPRLQVTVPATYRPQGPGNTLADLARAVEQSTTRTGHCA